MARRPKVGILFYVQEGWTGGTYYILNLIQALKTLPSHEQPVILVFSDDKGFALAQETQYPYLKFFSLQEVQYTKWEHRVNKISRQLVGRNIIVKEYTDKTADVYFPFFEHRLLKQVRNRLYWIPDFQEHYLPNFFDAADVEKRKHHQASLANSGDAIVFSSEDAKRDFEKFYPDYSNTLFVLNFAVTHPEYQGLDSNDLLKKYRLTEPYFFSPNQFWAHKNHLTVLKAVEILKQKGYHFTVAFSGKETDYRNPQYFDSLRKFVSEHGLEEQVRFLGFLDRRYQLKLMQQAIAIVQPSLFEGWSTVVEDAKAMNQYILLSDLKVHREQINDNASFFQPEDSVTLASLMEMILQKGTELEKKDYSLNVRNFGKRFMNIVKAFQTRR